MSSKGWKTGGAVFMALVISACGSDPVDAGNDELTVQDLYGTWEWISSEGGIAGTIRTPVTEGFGQQVVLRDPREIELFIDGQSVGATTFTFFPPDPGDGEPRGRFEMAESLQGFQPQFVGFDIEGTLMLTDPCCDRFVHRFGSVVGF